MSSVQQWMKAPLSQESYSNLKDIHKLLSKYQQRDAKYRKATSKEDFDQATKDPRSDMNNYTEVNSIKDSNGRNIIDILDQGQSMSLRNKLGISTGKKMLKDHIFKNPEHQPNPNKIYDNTATINAGAPIQLEHSELQKRVTHRLNYESHLRHRPAKQIVKITKHKESMQKTQRAKATREAKKTDRRIFADANHLKVYLKHYPHFNSLQYIDQHPKLDNKLNVINGSRLNNVLAKLTGKDPKANNSCLYNIDRTNHSFTRTDDTHLFSKVNKYITNVESRSLNSNTLKDDATKARNHALKVVRTYRQQLNHPMSKKDLNITKSLYSALNKDNTIHSRNSTDFSKVNVGNTTVSKLLSKTSPMLQHRLGIKSGALWHKQRVAIDKDIGKDPSKDSEVQFIKPNCIFSDYSLGHTRVLTRNSVLHKVKSGLEKDQVLYRNNHTVQSTSQIKHNLEDAVMLKMGIKNHDRFYCSDFLDQHPKFAKDAHMIGDRTFYHGGLDLTNSHKVFDTEPNSNTGYNTMNKADIFKRTKQYIHGHTQMLSESILDDKLSKRSINVDPHRTMHKFKQRPFNYRSNTLNSNKQPSVTDRMSKYLETHRGISR